MHDSLPSDREQLERTIAYHLHEVLRALGCACTDPGMVHTPQRVARMLVRESCAGLLTPPPQLTTFPKPPGVQGPVHVTGITIRSICEHHLLPMVGQATISYVPKEEVLGLSKLNRLAHWWAARPQLQERLTQQIHDTLQDALNLDSLAVSLHLEHACVTHRGARDSTSCTWTHQLTGAFTQESWLREAHFLACKAPPHSCGEPLDEALPQPPLGSCAPQTPRKMKDEHHTDCPQEHPVLSV